MYFPARREHLKTFVLLCFENQLQNYQVFSQKTFSYILSIQSEDAGRIFTPLAYNILLLSIDLTQLLKLN